MFKDWDDFYLIIGGASGALIGLLFVVATLTASLGRDQAMIGQRIYMTPIVFHLGVILTLSGITAAPGLDAMTTGALVAIAALMGLAYSAFVISRIRAQKTPIPHWSDAWCYGAAPGVIYLGLLGGALAFGASRTIADYAIATALTALLVVSIRNAWDLVTWLAPGASNTDNIDATVAPAPEHD
jgi:hypothetical protein